MLFLKNAKNLVFLNAYLWRENNEEENKKRLLFSMEE